MIPVLGEKLTWSFKLLIERAFKFPVLENTVFLRAFTGVSTQVGSLQNIYPDIQLVNSN